MSTGRTTASNVGQIIIAVRTGMDMGVAIGAAIPTF